MSKNNFSKEYLFRECVLNHRCILLRLYEAIRWNDTFVDEIYLVDICVEEDMHGQLIKNITNSVDTYGEIKIKAFAQSESVYDGKILTISTSDILEIELQSFNY